jgi:DNA modification methylase
MKPVEIVQRALVNSSKPGDLVLDLFLGSGTTLIAAHTLDRRCFGMEIDPIYADVVVKRFEDFTGKKAILESAA